MKIQLKVPTMACSACADTISKAVQTIDANAIVKADTKTKLVKIETQATVSAIQQAIIHAGYTVIPH